MTDYAPIQTNGVTPFTATTSAGVTGGTIAVWSGASTVGPAGAASTIVAGIFAADAASGAVVSVWPLEGLIHSIVAANNITALGGIQTAANGQADPVATSIAAGSAAGTLIGTAITTVTANGTNRVTFQGRR